MDSKYGFIINNEDSKDVFVHRSNIKELIKGDKVRFELKTKDCKNKSPYTFCKECYTNFNFVNDSLLSICEKCGIKKKGKFYICYECKGLE